jgi:hypothetical protein
VQNWALSNFSLDNKIQQLGRTVQADYEFVEKYAANPAAIILETQAVNFPIFVSPSDAQV